MKIAEKFLDEMNEKKDWKVEAIKHAIDLITKGEVEGAYKGIALPKLPQKTIKALEKIQKDLDIKQSAFAEILPQLKSIYNISGDKPKIQFYEGKEGIIQVFNDTLIYNTEILAFASEDMPKILGKKWAHDYINQRIEKGIFQKMISPKTDYLVENFIVNDIKEKRLTKLIEPKNYPFSIAIDIYGHQKVALMSGKEEMGIIIEGKEIHNTMKSIFNVLWDNLPEVGKKQLAGKI